MSQHNNANDCNDDADNDDKLAMRHFNWAPVGREGRSQAGPKGRQLEVGARRAPRLLVVNMS